MLTAALLTILALTGWSAFLYARPFGRCPRCHGKRHIMRGTKRKPRPATCPRCKGIGRRQRPGSRTVHQLARRVRRELDRRRKTPRTERTITNADRNL